MKKSLITITIVLLVLDAIYLKLIANHFNQLLNNIQGSDLKLKIAPAILCYILLVFSIYHFIVKDKKPVIDAFLLGIVIYGVYDATNMATIAKWTWKTVIMDTLWGGVLFAATYYITKKIHNF